MICVFSRLVTCMDPNAVMWRPFGDMTRLIVPRKGVSGWAFGFRVSKKLALNLSRARRRRVRFERACELSAKICSPRSKSRDAREKVVGTYLVFRHVRVHLREPPNSRIAATTGVLLDIVLVVHGDHLMGILWLREGVGPGRRRRFKS